MKNREVFSEEEKRLFSEEEIDMVNRNAEAIANAMINTIHPEHKATVFEKKFADRELNRLGEKYNKR